MSGMFTDRDADEDTAEGAEAEPAREGTAPPRASGCRRSRTVLVAAAFTVVTAVAAAGALGLGGDGDEDPAAPPRAGSTVAVTRATLVERTKVDGELGYGVETPLPAKASGTVTWLPEAGTIAERGDTLLRVDDRPVVLLYGTLPMYRELGMTAGPTPPAPGTTAPTAPRGAGGKAGGTGAGAGAGGTDRGTDADTGTGTDGGTSTGTATGTGTDGGTGTGAPPPPAAPAPPQPLRGMDVLQFESNLAALGYTGFTVDEEFTSGTERAVKRWQGVLGLPETGRVGLGDVVYASGRIRLGQAGVRLGAAAGENVLGYTGTSRKVVVDASAQEASWAVRGTEVTVALPDGTPVKGRVASVGRQATAPEGGPGAVPTVPVTITLADQRALGRLESGPVSVEYAGRKREDVLAVPVAALVALAEGGHGLETEDGRFVTARTGLFADGMVEVSGPALRAGLKVRIPQ
ncbi:peptidoglycan-binding domain-containing protein [Streptomyces globisporus]|uniref:peptidoglycan-binding domain-containing protein n=1 Tax=Streptomyces globisporus TaxID=1908 RepID=UPI0004CAB83E|nr:peptidoglycan-binding domain-containing protein [Streptomyces globisporus]